MLQQQQQIEQLEEQKVIECIPVCGGNLSSPVDKLSDYIEEIQYRIGSKLYIENAD